MNGQELTTAAGNARRDAVGAIAACGVLTVVALAVPSFPLFAEREAVMLQLHLLLELFAVIVSILVATACWYSFDAPQRRSTDPLIYGFSAVAVFDLVHALTYDGMPPLVTDSGTNRAIFFWLAGRAAAAVTLLAVAAGSAPPARRRTALPITAALTAAVLWVGTFRLDLVPVLFQEGVGVTAVKTACEVVLSLAYALAGVAFWRRAARVSGDREYALGAACFILAMCDLLFGNYKAPSDFINIFGHVFKVAAYLLIFRALFVATLRLPYDRARRAEADLSASEARLRALGDNLPNGMVYQLVREADGRMRFAYVSAGVERLNGVQAQAVLQDAGVLYDRLLPEDRAIVEREQRLSYDSMRPFEVTVRLRRADGELRWMQLSSAPRRLADGRVLWDGIQIDVTERVRAQESLALSMLQVRELNASLEQRVAERTRELEAFSYSVSHDLKAPARTIATFGELLQRRNGAGLDDEGRRLLQRIVSAGERMGRLINDLLGLAGVSSRRMQRVPMDLGETARATLERLAQEHPGRRVECSVAAGLDAHADPGLMAVVMDNLLGNAWKFTAKVPAARIEVCAIDGEAGRLYQVRDNGAGFDMSGAGKLFGAFERLHSEHEFEGTGIGLATVKRVIERHGGWVRISGAPGEGAIVEFALGPAAD